MSTTDSVSQLPQTGDDGGGGDGGGGAGDGGGKGGGDTSPAQLVTANAGQVDTGLDRQPLPSLRQPSTEWQPPEWKLSPSELHHEIVLHAHSSTLSVTRQQHDGGGGGEGDDGGGDGGGEGG